jgi:hypothetical protein
VELSSLQVDSLVPEPLAGQDVTVQQYMERLPQVGQDGEVKGRNPHPEQHVWDVLSFPGHWCSACLCYTKLYTASQRTGHVRQLAGTESPQYFQVM